MTTKREFIPVGDYVPLETKFGTIMVLPIDGEHANVEVRALIDGVHFCFALTTCVTQGQKALVGDLTEWSSRGTFTPRRKALLLEEVTLRVLQAANGPMAQAFRDAHKRVLNNSILSIEEDLERKRRELDELAAVHASLLEEEAAASPPAAMAPPALRPAACFRIRAWVGPCDVKHYAERARDLIPGVTEGTEHVLFARVDAPDPDDARALIAEILFGDRDKTRGIEAIPISAP